MHCSQSFAARILKFLLVMWWPWTIACTESPWSSRDELKTFKILAAKSLRLMIFDSILITWQIQNAWNSCSEKLQPMQFSKSKFNYLAAKCSRESFIQISISLIWIKVYFNALYTTFKYISRRYAEISANEFRTSITEWGLVISSRKNV